ncbi:MAG: rhamnogalacturonan endolyase [Chthoniobacter sp.]|jgi:rhamnogalacturonan endolyase|nr:rhamnogalacturonan endolyase [Chthoniobacter sp.]
MKLPLPPERSASRRANFITACVLCLFLALISASSALGAFGLTTATDYYTVDTGGGLVFKVRRTDNGVSTQSAGDLMSLVYNGVEYQDQSRGSQINSGFDFLGYSTSAVSVAAQVVNTNYIKVTVVAGDLTHYYLARNGYPHIYMATYFTTEPVTGGGLCRYILRIPSSKLPNGPSFSETRNTDFTVESGDIFGFSSSNTNTALIGQTRSKHYSNMRIKDWSYIGATGTNVGLWILRDSNEGGSGGPFYRSLINQGASDQEITYILNYGEGQTEAFRTSILNGPYTLVFTDGTTPTTPDTSWVANLGLTGYVGASSRGSVTCGGITGRDTRFAYTVGFSNSTAQYWTDASAANGSFAMTNMLPGTYTMRVYKNEFSVYSASVTAYAGGTVALSAIAIAADPSRTVPLWRIGNWDGTPAEFLNGGKVTIMHPSDVRITGTNGTAAWAPGPYAVDTSSPVTGMPCYQWKGVNANQVVQFDLTAGQLAASTVKVGLTTAYAGGRPNIAVNSWTSGLQGASTQPDSRTLTVGTYRGNNTTYTFSVPASALVTGTNTLTIYPISGSGGSGYLSPGYSIDCIEMSQGNTTVSPPGAPASLSATAGSGSVALSWPAVSGATSYLVQRATVSGGPYLTVGEPVSPSYSNTGVGAGTTYYYIVKALNTAGAGLASTEASAAISGSVSAATHLAFDEASGTTAADASGNGWTGTLSGGATFAAGKIGNAVNLSGSSQFVSLPAGVVASTNDFTISTWVKLTASTASARIFDFGTGTGNSMSLTARSDTGRPRFVIRTWSASEQVIDSSVAIPTGTWTHLAISLTGTTGTLFLNGVPVGTSSGVTLRPYQLGITTQNYLGKSQSASDPYLNGLLDDFRIYSRGLTGAEIYPLWGGGGTNQAPIFTAKPTVFPVVNQGVNYSTLAQSLASAATDANGGSLTFTKLSGPAWLIVAANGTLSGTSANADVGLNQFSIRVTDSNGASDNTDLRITVNNVNDAPTWFGSPFTREPVTTGQSYPGTSLSGWASDPDQITGDTISFSKLTGPSWLSVASNGALSGTPAAGEVGTNTFTARVTDAAGLSSDATFTIQVVAPAIQARYAFDGSGANSQGGAPATIAGTASYVTGVFGQALNLDGSTNSVDLGALSGTLYKDFTASAWIWRNSSTDNQRIFDFGSGTDEYLALMLVGSNLRFQFVESGITQILNAPIPALGQWAQVAVTLSGSTATIYVNGTAVASSNSFTNEPSNVVLTYNYLGKSQFAADPLFNGKIDDFRLYNYGLSGSEIAALVSVAPSLPPTGLIAGASGAKVTLTWSAVPNAQSYNIRRGTTSGGPYPTSIATGVTATTYADTTVVSGTTYYYVVTANSVQGESVNSNEGVAVVSDLVAWLKFNESTGAAKAADSSGNTWDGNLFNTPTWTSGILKNAVNLSGASQYLSLPGGIVSGLGDFTVSTWVKVGAFATFSRIFDFGTSTTNYMFLTTQYTGTAPNAARLRFAIRTPGVTEDPAGSALNQIDSSVALPVGTWAHVAVTLTGTTGRLYLNGTQVGITTTMTLKPSDLGSTALNYLGRSQFNADPYLNAALDDFRIYSRALSASELTALANPAAEAPDNVTVIPDDGKVNLSWTVPNAATTYTVKRSLTSGGTYTPVANGSGLTATSFIDTGLTNGVTYYYIVTSSNSLGESPKSAEVAVTPSYLRIHLKFDETSGTLAADSSGRGLDATTVNSPTWDDGHLDNALTLAQASSQYVTLPAGVVSNLTNATIMCWVKTASVATSQRIFDFGTGTDNYLFLTTQYVTGGNANKLRFSIRTPGVPETAVNQISSSTATPSGTWAHVAVVFNGSTGTLYLDGVQVGQSTAMTLTPSSLGSTTLNYLGKSQFSDPYLNASLDDFRIYSRAMADTEIAAFAASPLPAPQNVAATAGTSQVSLSWSAVGKATSYNVKRSTTAGGPYPNVINVAALTRTDSGLVVGTPYYYVISAVNLAGESANSAEVTAVPIPVQITGAWVGNDIGNVGAAGSAGYSNGTFTLTGSGVDIGGSSDGFQYAYQTLTGDGGVIARIVTQSGGKSGVMMRETQNANSRFVDLILQAGAGAEFDYRGAVGGNAVNGGAVSSIGVPYWVKLERVGNVFTGSISSDNVSWTQVAPVTLNSMSNAVYLGLVQTSMDNSALSTATFDHVVVFRPLVITVPASITVEATSPAGAAVTFATSAVDNTGTEYPTTNTPASGSTFALGTTIVTTTATDAAGHSASKTFTVTVLDPAAPAVIVTPVAQAGPIVKKQPTGELVPSGYFPAGATFGAFFTPALSDDRQIVARVTVLSGKAKLGAIFVKDAAGTGTLPAYQTGPALDAAGHVLPGATFESFIDPVMTAGGAIAFKAKLAGSVSGSDEGVWGDLFSPNRLEMRLLLREGGDVPGFANGEKLKSVSSLSVRNGQLLAVVTLTPAPNVVTAQDDSALLLLTGTQTGLVLLREGRPLQTVPGSAIKSFSVLQPALGSPGQGRWQGENLVVAKVTLASGEVQIVKLAHDGLPTKLLSTADAATPVSAQAKWTGFGLPAMGSHAPEFVVSATLQQKLAGVTAREDTVLLSSPDGTTWTPFAREDGLTPISSDVDGPRYASFFEPVANDAGAVAFLSTLQGADVGAKDKAALFCGDAADLRLAARLGGQVPDLDGNLTEAVWSKFISYALPSGDGAGILFLAETSGGDTNAKNKLGLWAADSGGKLRRLLRTGTAPVINGPTLTSFTLLNTLPGSYGATRSYNETGSVAVLANFADKTQAFLRIDIP